ncbi:MAG: exonuclease [Acidobacteria bacterium]|nr:MAG: exonuclease [Acidobacteriota bacterium]
MRTDGMNFVAIDFETADYGRDSACAVGMVRVEDGVITHRKHRLIRPPRPDFIFTYIHGITWEDVAGEPEFGEVWAPLAAMLDGVDFLVAHNAPFDRGVLRACCAEAGLDDPDLPWECTVRMARRILKIKPATLDNVCRTLDIELQHHQALSDAEACAQIVLRAQSADADRSR